jgi:hypothetical protein
MKLQWIIVCSLFLSSLCVAQFIQHSDTLETAPGKDKIRLIQDQSTVYGGAFNAGPRTSLIYRFKVGDGDIHGAGYFGNGLRKYINSNPQAIQEMDKFKSKRVMSVVGYGGMVVFIDIGAAIGLNEDTGERVYNPRKDEYINKKKGKPEGLTFMGLAMFSLIMGGANYFGASKHLINAVEIYNEKQDEKSPRLNFKLTPEINRRDTRMRFCVRW